MIQNFDKYILVNEDDWCILWNTGAFNKTKQKINRLRGSPVYSYLKELSVHFLCFCFEIKI